MPRQGESSEEIRTNHSKGTSPNSNAAGKLSPRESEVFELLRRGLSYAEVAEALGVSCNTVKVLAYRIRRKGVELGGPKLSLKERRVLELLERGLPYREVARILGVSPCTVGWYAYKLRRRGFYGYRRKHSVALASLSIKEGGEPVNQGQKLQHALRKPATFGRGFTTALRVLAYISKGLFAAEIARKLGVHRSTVSRILKKLERLGLVCCSVRSSVKVYELTEKGAELLRSVNPVQKLRVNVGGDDASESGRGNFGLRFRVDGFSLRFPVVREGFWPGRYWWEVKGWRAGKYKFGNLTLVKTPRSIIAYLGSFYGENPWRALLDAHLYVLAAMRDFQERYGWVLGAPVPNTKPSFEFADPFIRSSGRISAIRNSEGFVDASRGDGEIGFLDPELADAYIRMVTEVPWRVEELRERVARVEGLLARISENLEVFAEAMDEHVALIGAINRVVEELRVAVKELREALRHA